MFGGNRVGDGTGLLHVTDLDQGAAIGQGGTNHVLAWHVINQAVDAGFYLGQVVSVGTQQD